MGFIMIDEEFICENCGEKVNRHPDGSARNHCPKCLYSKHVDDEFPGDRKSTCGALLKPVDIEYKKNKGYMIMHECTKCGKRILNKIASDDDFISFIETRNKKLTSTGGHLR